MWFLQVICMIEIIVMAYAISIAGGLIVIALDL